MAAEANGATSQASVASDTYGAMTHDAAATGVGKRQPDFIDLLFQGETPNSQALSLHVDEDDENMQSDSLQAQNEQVHISQVEANLKILNEMTMDLGTEAEPKGKANVSTPQEISNIYDTGLRHIYINDAIKGQGKSVAHTNPITRMTELKSLIGGYKACKTTRAGSLIIEVHNFEQVKTILSLEKLMGIAVKSNLATDIGTSKGYAHEPRVMDIYTHGGTKGTVE